MKFLNKIVDGGIIPFVMGTQTAATGSWTGTAHTLTSLNDGQVICYWLPFAGSGSATLNLTLANGTQTGAINCYYQGTSRLTTHYPAGSMIMLIYRSNVRIGANSYTGWWGHGQYYSDTTYYQRYNSAIYAAAAITAGNIIVNTGTGYKHLNTGEAFDITMPILYAGSAISSGATGSNNYVGYYFSVAKTQSGSWTAYKPIFIKGTLSGKMFTPISVSPLTQTIPTSDDGYLYYLIGYCYSTTNMQLTVEKCIYKYVNGTFQPFVGASAYAITAGEAGKLSSSRTISLTGGVTGSGSFDGSSNLSISTTVSGSSHTHTKSQISDFPTSMPASDVYAWAKAASKPSYTFSEIGSKPTTLSGYGITDAASSSHTHGNITNDGKIGSNTAADQFVITTTNGALTTANASTALSKLGISVTATQLNYVSGVTSNIQTQLNNKAPLASPVFTGTPTAPTPTAGDNSTKIATTAFVKNAIDNISSGGGEVGYAEYTALDGGQGVTNINLTNSHAYVTFFFDFDGNFSINISAIPAGKKRYLYMYTTTNINVAISKPSYLIYMGDEIPASLSLFHTLVCFEITRMPGSSDIVAVKKVTYL